MRVRRFTLTALVVLVLGVAGAVAATAGDDDLTLWARELRATDLAPDGTDVTDDEDRTPEVGDRFMIVDELFADDDLTDEVGTNTIHCTVNDVVGESEDDFAMRLLCHGVARLDGDDLSWQALAVFSSDDEPDEDDPFVTVAITGGTGDLDEAAGQIELFETDDPDVVRYEVDLD